MESQTQINSNKEGYINSIEIDRYKRKLKRIQNILIT
jgi:hypothetical protein